MERYFEVYNEEWEAEKRFGTLEEAKAWRYQKHGYAGYILEKVGDEEIASHS